MLAGVQAAWPAAWPASRGQQQAGERGGGFRLAAAVCFCPPLQLHSPHDAVLRGPASQPIMIPFVDSSARYLEPPVGRKKQRRMQ